MKDGQKIGAWLSAVAVKKKDIPIEDCVTQDLFKHVSVEDETNAILLRDWVRLKLSELKPEHRQLLYLRYHYDLTEKEIAQRMNMSIGTIKSRLFRAKKKLKENLAGSSDWENENVRIKNICS